MHKDSHLSDHELLLAIDGELPARDSERVQAHLAACWGCRARGHELESAIADFVRVHQRTYDAQLPPADGSRALLKAHMAEIAKIRPAFWPRFFIATQSWRVASAVGAVLALALLAGLSERFWQTREGIQLVAVPNPSLTPGATILVNRGEVCRESNTKNKTVPVALQRRVFEEYGITKAEPQAYEVDYLITPALGGADDIHNLWPQSYAHTAWNAEVKDALEDHLRELVCDGKVELATAQRDIADNWIEAYKKYFHTDRPLDQVHP